MKSEMESLMTSGEVGKVLGIHPKVVERMAKRGEPPGLKVDRLRRWQIRKGLPKGIALRLMR